jgi:CheY-like chemotaxis protein
LRPGSRNFPIPRQGPEDDGILGVTTPRGLGETVLVVAGDSDLRGLAAGLLDALGYRVLQAGDGPSALKVLQQAASVDLLITDVVLPDAMTARELAGEARALFPDLAVLYTSSDSDEAVRQVKRLEDGAELIGRPCRTGDLARRVRAVLGGRKP